MKNYTRGVGVPVIAPSPVFTTGSVPSVPRSGKTPSLCGVFSRPATEGESSAPRCLVGRRQRRSGDQSTTDGFHVVTNDAVVVVVDDGEAGSSSSGAEPMTHRRFSTTERCGTEVGSDDFLEKDHRWDRKNNTGEEEDVTIRSPSTGYVVVGCRYYQHRHRTIARLTTFVGMITCFVILSCGRTIPFADGFQSPILPITTSRSNYYCLTVRYGTNGLPDPHHDDNDKNGKHHGNKHGKANHNRRRPPPSSSSSRRRANGRSSSPPTVTTPAAANTRNATTHGVAATDSSVDDAMQRISQLEDMVAKQAVEMKRLRDECKSLSDAVNKVASVMELLYDAGSDQEKNSTNNRAPSSDAASGNESKKPTVKSLEDDDEIFGKAPSSIMDAADAAGAAVLAGLLAGQRRLLVDVRDAELSKPDQLVQFLELTILPVAAGLEGLKSKRNRLKLVFPKVSQLLEYRKRMALAAPEVVALSTMDFDPIESHDNLVVILAPHPDDTEGVQAMNTLLDPKSGITQPVVVFNPHMAPVSDPAADFEVAYQLRLFTVHYIAKPPPPTIAVDDEDDDDDDDDEQTNYFDTKDQLAAAMQHAKEVSRNPMEHGGMTRSMLIRAYPNPWNVFVDISPDTDADFVVAATFAQEPTPHELNTAVIECLQGSEEEDELVAQQMQQALEAGQLDRVSEILSTMGLDFSDDDDDDEDDEDDDDDEDDEDDDDGEDLWQLPDVDTV